ncbi:MAG: B12-binding domain-containing radical SAM protein [Armatimonadetes bacterium]|nr:B12-binding domain-containing radical SAM protein [Armatimonadota bacterium]
MIALIAGPQKPPRSFQGLGLPYLAAVLEEGGFEVRICDKYPTTPDTDEPAELDDALAGEVADQSPSVVGVTVHTPTVVERVRLASCLRRRLPDALLVAGGHHATAEPEELLRGSEFDVCVIGEGEYALLEIAQRAEAAGRATALERLGGVRGIAYKGGEGIVRTASRPAADFDAMPMQAHHLLGLDDYGPHPNLGIRSVGLLTQRGCAVRCAFCLNPQGSLVRKRHPASVVDEMAEVVSEFGVSGFNVYDNMFGVDRRHAAAVCDAILRRRLQVTWECWTGGHLVNGELAERMRAAGCVRVGFGAESGDDGVLKQARRGFRAAQHQAGLHALRSAGVKTEVFYMLGLPGESRESVRRTVEFARQCGADSTVFGVYRPYPGTAVWRHPESFGVRITRGPNYEAYAETTNLSRSAILESVEWAGEELNRSGVRVDFLRRDQYAWERN